LWKLWLHWFVVLFYCGWQHASLVQQLLDSLMNQNALHMAAFPISKHFIALQTPIMISLAYFLTLIMTQLVIYLAREWIGSLHSLRSSYFMTTYSLALLIYGIAMPSGLLVLSILCGATYKHIMSMATRII